MPIISMSLNEKMVDDLDKIQNEMGFSGRSEVIRAGIRMLISDMREKETLIGRLKGVLLLIHEHEAEDFVNNTKHKFLDIIYTQLHNRLKDDKCLELFILDGEAERAKQLIQLFQKNGDIEYAKLLVT